MEPMQMFMILVEFLTWLAGGTVVALLFAYLVAFFNVFFTFVRTGEIKVLMRGGTIYKLLANVPGWTYREDIDTMVELSTLGLKRDPSMTLLNRLFGIYYIGPWPLYTIDWWWLEWDKVHVNPTSELGYAIEHRKERVQSILFRYPYFMKVPAAEIQGNFTYDLNMVGDLLSLHPMRMISQNPSRGYWLTLSIATVLDAGRVYASQRKIDELRENLKPGTSTPESFGEVIMQMVNTPASGLGMPEHVGTKLDALKLISVELHDPTGTLKKASTAKAVAIEEADAKVVAAEGEATAKKKLFDAEAHGIEVRGTAEAARIKNMVQAAASAPGGPEILQMQSFSDGLRDGLIGTKATTVVIGSSTPGLMLNSATIPASTPTKTTP